MDIVTESPDRTRKVHFVYAGEVRFGPPYYSVECDGRVLRAWLRRRYFGSPHLFSSDSRFLALQEWRGFIHQPDTRLVVRDLASRAECTQKWASGAFVRPLRFEGQELLYESVTYGPDRQPTIEQRRITLPPRLNATEGWLS